jgi:thiamine biosynthesis lipoprotein
LEICKAVHRQTNGLFDPTVQPLWHFYAQWFAGRPNRAPPSASERARLLSHIGMEHLSVSSEVVALSGAAEITLNGIAQGYITDRIAAVLRDRGWSNVLIDLGEVRALGVRPDGTPFAILVRDTGRVLPLANAAMATSSAASLAFSAPLGLAHILHPRTGMTPGHWLSVTVQHPSATVADALSTALFLASRDELNRIARRFPGTLVWATKEDGATQVFSG